MKNVQSSLLVCGLVSGPAHVTNVQDSVLVISCRQLRMHDCRNVDVYLACSSRPIIEDCEGIRFGKLPNTYVSHTFRHYLYSSSLPLPFVATSTLRRCLYANEIQEHMHEHDDQGPPAPNMWDQVDDFKWLKAEQSPNWSILPAKDTVQDEVWREIVPGGPGWTLEDILKATGVLK